MEKKTLRTLLKVVCSSLLKHTASSHRQTNPTVSSSSCPTYLPLIFPLCFSVSPRFFLSLQTNIFFYSTYFCTYRALVCFIRLQQKCQSPAQRLLDFHSDASRALLLCCVSLPHRFMFPFSPQEWRGKHIYMCGNVFVFQ